MSSLRPILAAERLAAKLLDMSQSEFRGLVSVGALPPPIDFNGLQRWRVADLEAIADGTILDEDDFET